jgi:hypothetical protein
MVLRQFVAIYSRFHCNYFSDFNSFDAAKGFLDRMSDREELFPLLIYDSSIREIAWRHDYIYEHEANEIVEKYKKGEIKYF